MNELINQSVEVLCYGQLYIEQIIIMTQKHISQKQRSGRKFLKDTIMVQFFFLLFVAYVIIGTQSIDTYKKVYYRHDLPPLSEDAPYGIFDKDSKGSVESNTNILSKRLYYCPDTNEGVVKLMMALETEYPDVETKGFATPADILDEYETNLFDTWAAVEFTLTPEQISNNSLTPNRNYTFTGNKVSYTIRISPTSWSGRTLSSEVRTDSVYNKIGGNDADFFWSSGYLTLQNFIDVYIAKQYEGVDPHFKVLTKIQRYPKDDIYDDDEKVSIQEARFNFWRWMGGTVLSICLFVPMLSLLTEIVRERQYRMKDLLEISGLMNASYWSSYLVTIFAICQISMWISIGCLSLFTIFNEWRTEPYAALCTCYILAAISMGMLFGFLVDRADYYGLPVFMLNTSLTICGAYMGIDTGMSKGAKLFVCFLCPPIGLVQGILTIETYLYHNNSHKMDWSYEDENRNFPCLNDINGMLLLHFGVVFIIVLLMPFDFIFKSHAAVEGFLNAKADEITFPSDIEEVPERKEEDENLLVVKSLSHIYPDGTNAVKDMNFKVKKGEVLSFLGANGAGKSTCMGMLCGTLEATIGDATVNGFSITRDRVLARRNLGIAMQQDIIWNDVNVEDHLLLFGRLRGLHGQKLRDDVAAMAISLGFPDKVKALAGNLSGGQKRRLCVGLSMVGGNSVVYLDEPTAGLDPVSRRQLWELVQKNREGRAILLTTHFMDEADVLGDRIAVVKEGRLRALGTSKFLKERFGLGYLMRMSLLGEGANVPKIVDRIQSYIPTAMISSHAGTELSIRLPREAVSVFPDMFAALEGESGKQLGISSYGIETTTLEEVFMRIVNEDNEMLLGNHAEANRLIGAPADERDQVQLKIIANDEKKLPLDEELMQSLLTKGTHTV